MFSARAGVNLYVQHYSGPNVDWEEIVIPFGRARRISDVPCARASQIAFISHFLRAQNPTPSYLRARAV